MQQREPHSGVFVSPPGITCSGELFITELMLEREEDREKSFLVVTLTPMSAAGLVRIGHTSEDGETVLNRVSTFCVVEELNDISMLLLIVSIHAKLQLCKSLGSMPPLCY